MYKFKVINKETGKIYMSSPYRYENSFDAKCDGKVIKDILKKEQSDQKFKVKTQTNNK